MRLLSFLYLSVLACGSAFAAIPASEIWPTPTPPAGTNPAEFAAPRNDWLDRVQAALDKTAGKHYDILFDGDSITDGWQGKNGRTIWEARFVPLNAYDFGISGDRVEHVLWRLKQGQGAAADPKLVVLMIGTNNMGRDSADQIAAGIKNLVPVYLKQCPHARLLLLGIFPRAPKPDDPYRAKIKEVNRQIATLDDGGNRVTFLDIGEKFLEPDGTLSPKIMPDYLHPNEAGYRIWADAIYSEIAKTFPDAPKENPPVEAPAPAPGAPAPAAK